MFGSCRPVGTTIGLQKQTVCTGFIMLRKQKVPVGEGLGPPVQTNDYFMKKAGGASPSPTE